MVLKLLDPTGGVLGILRVVSGGETHSMIRISSYRTRTPELKHQTRPNLSPGDDAVTNRDMQEVGVYQAIYGRRMAWEFEDSPVSTSAIERMLDAAVWAPNHRLTEPWRFFVLQKDSPARLQAAELARETVLERSGNSRRAEAASQMVLDPPYVVYVYCVPGDNEEQTRENYAAVCCAVQNMALAGVAEGLAVTWETGGVTRAPGLIDLLGADKDWTLATMLSIGVHGDHTASRRTPASQFARWFMQE